MAKGKKRDNGRKHGTSSMTPFEQSIIGSLLKKGHTMMQAMLELKEYRLQKAQPPISIWDIAKAEAGEGFAKAA